LTDFAYRIGSSDTELPAARWTISRPDLANFRRSKGETRLDGFDDKIISMYACGMARRHRWSPL
jgi:hypothetical protein